MAPTASGSPWLGIKRIATVFRALPLLLRFLAATAAAGFLLMGIAADPASATTPSPSPTIVHCAPGGSSCEGHSSPAPSPSPTIVHCAPGGSSCEGHSSPARSGSHAAFVPRTVNAGGGGAAGRLVPASGPPALWIGGVSLFAISTGLLVWAHRQR
jgi:hypothetical protein